MYWHSSGFPPYSTMPTNLLCNYLSPNKEFTAPIHHVLNSPSNFGIHCISEAEADFLSLNRILWEEHVKWTRLTMISIIFNLPDLPDVQGRLLRNAADVGNSIRPFYGDQIADDYASLIHEHLVLAAELVAAAAKGDAKQAAEKEKEWYRNADDIAEFLSSINPFLSEEMVRSMFYTHLGLTKHEAVSIIEKNYKEGIVAFDDIEAQARAMADMIADGIIEQFPMFFC